MRTKYVILMLLSVAILGGGGSAVAAKRYLISSSAQLKPGVITTSRLSKATQRQLRGRTGGRGPAGAPGATGPAGQAGPAGTPGPAGVAGAAHGYRSPLAGQQAIVALPESGGAMTLTSLALPAGDHMITARVQGTTDVDPDGAPDTTYRLTCAVTSSVDGTTADTVVHRPGTAPNVGDSIALTGALHLTTPQAVDLKCRSGNGHPISTHGSSMTAITVAGLD